MKQCEIKLVILGASGGFFSLKKIEKHKSSFFKIVEVDHKVNLPEPEHDSVSLAQKYLDEQLIDIMGIDKNILTIGIINCKLQNNFYLRRISHKTAVLSINTPLDILSESNISIENFIIKNIYEIVTMYIISNFKLDSEEAASLRHQDTRKCLFDLNGDISTIKYNTERPILCSACKDRISNANVPLDLTKKLEKELSKIKKGKITVIELKIKKYPLLSILITIILGIIINIISNIIFSGVIPN
jgi:hypothetical protein